MTLTRSMVEPLFGKTTKQGSLSDTDSATSIPDES